VLGVQSMLAKVTHWYRNLCFQMFLSFLLGRVNVNVTAAAAVEFVLLVAH
jgi:hypothetical protein